MQLNPKALGLASGIFAGVCWLLMMGFSLLTGIGELTITTWGSWHPFFSYSWAGLVIMVIEHLIGGFIVGCIIDFCLNNFNFYISYNIRMGDYSDILKNIRIV